MLWGDEYGKGAWWARSVRGVVVGGQAYVGCCDAWCGEDVVVTFQGEGVWIIRGRVTGRDGGVEVDFARCR
jgi:hypothetical protein